MTDKILPLNKTIIMFDGVCNLCNGLILFLIPRDLNERFLYASLQSKTAKEILKEKANLDPEKLDSVVVLTDGKVFTKSQAVLEIFKKMEYPWKFLVVGKILPTWFADRVYDFVGKNRYKWFGKKDQCMIPTAEILDKFLK